MKLFYVKHDVSIHQIPNEKVHRIVVKIFKRKFIIVWWSELKNRSNYVATKG